MLDKKIYYKHFALSSRTSDGDAATTGFNDVKANSRSEAIEKFERTHDSTYRIVTVEPI